jgi:hypothetical protein
MVEKVLLNNAKSAKWVIGSLVVSSIFIQKVFVSKALVSSEVYGVDGNGGRMLKIITNLTDEEIARLKYVRRLSWHWKGSRKLFEGKETISE